MTMAFTHDHIRALLSALASWCLPLNSQNAAATTIDNTPVTIDVARMRVDGLGFTTNGFSISRVVDESMSIERPASISLRFVFRILRDSSSSAKIAIEIGKAIMSDGSMRQMVAFRGERWIVRHCCCWER